MISSLITLAVVGGFVAGVIVGAWLEALQWRAAARRTRYQGIPMGIHRSANRRYRVEELPEATPWLQPGPSSRRKQ